MAVYVSRGSEEIARRLLAFVIRIGAVHLRPITNTLYQQDNARPHVTSRFLTFLDTQGIRLLSWQAWFTDLSPIEKFWSWVAERLTCHPSPDNTVEEVGDRLEPAWDELPFSVIVIQAQFDFILNRVRTVLAARGGSCSY
ncbi:hypothetical protein TNCV_1864551 [Trichonephila clavipes]|nr:hypothetical protein TNCV_1864551 [Trichonephila clavipes]